MTDGGVVTERTTYSIAGQMVGVRVKVSGGSNTLYYTYTDHLGSVVAMSDTAGGVVSGSLARYDPFGNYRTWPGSNVNPLISDRGFTGHVHDNTGDYPTQNVGLIYMNARYYLPEVGRFVSADTIVPEAKEPQSYNRYAYVHNSPLNFTDPTGHREIGASANDLLPHEIPFPTLSNPEPVFYGLPVPQEAVKWIRGYGANNFAAEFADPSKVGKENAVYGGSSGLHSAIDFGANAGTPVYSNVHGIVIIPSAFPRDASPNVTIQLDNGMTVNYGHVNIDLKLVPGTEVLPGTLIGTVVDQGTNSHVHLALRTADRSFNPAYFFADDSVDSMLRTIHYRTPGETPYTMTSFKYQGSNEDRPNYWEDGPHRVGV